MSLVRSTGKGGGCDHCFMLIEYNLRICGKWSKNSLKFNRNKIECTDFVGTFFIIRRKKPKDQSKNTQ